VADKILLVDDDREFRSEFRELLEDYDVLEASNGKEALALLQRANEIKLVILDVMMPGLSGTEVLREIKKQDPDLGIIILTAFSSKDVVIDALKGHADDYIEKPLDPQKIREVIERILDLKRGKETFASDSMSGKIEKVKRFIERNCFKKVALKEAAEAVFLSPKYLSRIFKQKTKMGFNEYKLKTKIERAKELLTKSGYNVNQVSEKLGYENTESFIRQFKKFTRLTPTSFREKLLRTTKRKK
jgi:two-component system response regulator YesN